MMLGLKFRWIDGLKMLALTLVYALAIILMTRYLTNDAAVAGLLWLPSGLGLAALLIYGRHYALAIFLGALMAYGLIERPFWATLWLACSATLEATLGVWLLTHGFSRLALCKFHQFDPKLTHPYDYLLLVLTAATSAALATLLAALSLWQTDMINAANVTLECAWWWMGDFLGIVLFTPVLLVWQKMPDYKQKRRKALEASLCLLLTFLMNLVVFFDWGTPFIKSIALGYWLFLLVTWSAVRLGRRCVTLMLLLITAQALFGTLNNTGVFANELLQMGLYRFWFYSLILTAVGTTLALAISSRDYAENQLRTLLVAVEQSPTSIIITDLNYKIQYVNPFFTETTGYSFLEALGQDAPLLNGVLIDTASYQQLHTKLSQGQRWSGEFMNQRKTGGWYWEYACIAPVYNDKANTVSHYVLVKVDISERKRAEEQALSASSYARGLLETSLDPMVTISVAGKIMDVNSATEIATGLRRTALIHSEFARYFTQPEQARAIYAQVIAKGAVTNYPLTLKHCSGKLTEVLYNATLYRAANGEVAGIFAAARDVTELKRTQRREHSRYEVLELLASNASLHTVLHKLINHIVEDLPPLHVAVVLFDEQCEYSTTLSSSPLAFLNEAAFLRSLLGGLHRCPAAQRVIIADIQQFSCPENIKTQASYDAIDAVWAEPILSKLGKVLGILALCNARAGEPDAPALLLLEQTTLLAAVVIEHCQSLEQQQLAALVYHSSSEGMAVTDANHRVLTVNPAFTQITGYSLAEIVGTNPQLLCSTRHDASFFEAMTDTLNATGQWQGEIWKRHKNGTEYAEQLTINTIFNDDGSVHRRVALFFDITEKKKTDELIWRQANFDSLTQLPNRHLFQARLQQELQQANRHDKPLVLMFLDLDRFKEINDTLGHDMGDILLKEAAQRLINCVRMTDTVARLGGDEFVVIFPALHKAADIDHLAKTILAALTAPFLLKNKIAHISTSIGVAVYPNDASDAINLLKNADQAMYHAKERGRNCHCYFTAAMQSAAQARLQTINDLHAALEGQQFYLLYQPIVELTTLTIHKAEALIRWQHPKRGLINPQDFIAIAEETRLIVEIGDWVFRTAAQQVALWRQDLCPDFQISINKSPIQFQARPLHHCRWFEYLSRLGVSGQGIVVEITEGLLLEAHENVIEQLVAFRENGMQVSLDDFGTGYCALAYLKKFAIDYLKIDQTFVRHLATDSNDAVLCEAIIVMAHKLGIKVIAEGIETQAQLHLLTRMGCDYGQGYFFAKPLNAEAFTAFVKQKNAPRLNHNKIGIGEGKSRA